MDQIDKDYKLKDLTGENPWGNMVAYHGLLKSIKTDELRSVVGAFGVNILRVESLILLPAMIGCRAELHGMGAPLTSTPVPPLEHSNELRLPEDAIKASKDMLERFCEFAHLLLPATAIGIDALLSAMLIGTWTAFETLAGDLLTESINAQPRYLAALVGNGNRIQNLIGLPATSNEESKTDDRETEPDTDDDDSYGAQGDKKIALGLMCRVTRGDYDLRKRMGDLLVRSERVKFISLTAIREAYSLAFPEKVRHARSHRIDAALSTQDLDALSALRNILVHKAGKVDDDYIEDCKIAPTAPKPRNGVVHIDGHTCRSLIDPVIKTSMELVRAVDSWLTLTRR